MNLETLSHESLAPYLPIKRAEWDLGWLLTFLTITVGGAAAILFVGVSANPNGHAMQLAGLVTLVPGMIGVTALAANLIRNHTEFGGNPFKWFRAFWNRNIRGYELWCVRNLYGDPTVTYEVHRRGHELSIHEGVKVIIAVPLRQGARGRIRITEIGGDRSWWSARLYNTVFSSTANLIIVEMQDANGDRFKIGVERALRIIASERSTLTNDGMANMAGETGWLIHGLMDRLDASKSDLAAERTTLEAERGDRDTAVVELYQAAERIDGTTRFVRSVQAMSIRAWLLERYRAHENVRPVKLPGQIDC